MSSAILMELSSARSRVVRIAAPISAVLAMGSLVVGGVLTDTRLLGHPVVTGANSLSWLLPVHRDTSLLAIALVLITGIFAFRGGQRVSAGLAGLACAAGLVDGLTSTSLKAVSLHAIAGVAVFACMAATAVLSWGSAEPLPSMPVPSTFPVRGTAVWIPWVVLSQVAMGSLYRHDLWSVMPHMAGAMVTAFLLIADAVLILQAPPVNPLLVRCARWALAAVLVQVMLGITDFLLRLLDFQNSLTWQLTSVSHVLVGGITFAVSIVFALMTRAYVPE